MLSEKQDQAAQLFATTTLSQSDIAKQVQVNKSTITRWQANPEFQIRTNNYKALFTDAEPDAWNEAMRHIHTAVAQQQKWALELVAKNPDIFKTQIDERFKKYQQLKSTEIIQLINDTIDKMITVRQSITNSLKPLPDNIVSKHMDTQDESV